MTSKLLIATILGKMRRMSGDLKKIVRFGNI